MKAALGQMRRVMEEEEEVEEKEEEEGEGASLCERLLDHFAFGAIWERELLLIACFPGPASFQRLNIDSESSSIDSQMI